jgi:hypothetical protein
MEQVEFRESPGKSPAVLVGGRVVGHILEVKGKGYRYAPKGSTLRGEIMPTCHAVKQSLRRAPDEVPSWLEKREYVTDLGLSVPAPGEAI